MCKGDGKTDQRKDQEAAAMYHGWYFLADFLEARHMERFDEMFQK